MLKDTENAPAIANFYVPRYRADASVSERLHELGYRVAFDDGIGIHDDDHIGPRGGESVIERRGFATILFLDNGDAPIIRRGAARGGGGRIVGAVVDHDDLEVRIDARAKRCDAARDDELLAIGRDEHGDGRRARGRDAGSARVPRGDEDDDDQPGEVERGGERGRRRERIAGPARGPSHC